MNQIARTLIIALFVATQPVSHAQSLPIGTPGLPYNLAPPNYLQRGTLTGSAPFDTDFTWRSRVGSLLYPFPTHFAICLHPAPPTGPASCDWISKRWSAMATGGGGLTRTAYFAPGTVLALAYDYRFDPPTQLEGLAQDQPLVWTVAACIARTGAPGGFACNAAAFQSAYFVASNLTATAPAYSRPNGTYLDIDIRATTIGSRAVDHSRFDVRIDVWEALTVAVPPNNVLQCRVDYLAADIQANPTAFAVIRTDGAVSYANQVPAGTPPDQIAGIFAFVSWAGSATSNIMTDPSQSIPADRINPFGVYAKQITPMANGRGFIVRGTVDTGNRLVEFDETDNAYARCKAF